MTTTRLLLLPGFLSAPSAWDGVADRLPAGVAVFRGGLPGFGSEAADVATYSLDAVVEALRPAVESIAPTHVVGHSMGGIIALALALAYPKIEGVGVVGLPVYDDSAQGRRFLGRRGLAIRLLVGHHRLAHAGCLAARTCQRAWVPAAQLRWRQQPPAVFRNAFMHSAASHEGALANIIFGGHIREMASSVRCPVLLIHGADDRAAPLGEARKLAAGAGWGFRCVPGGTHQVHVERPAIVAHWLQSVLAAPRAAEAQ